MILPPVQGLETVGGEAARVGALVIVAPAEEEEEEVVVEEEEEEELAGPLEVVEVRGSLCYLLAGHAG